MKGEQFTISVAQFTIISRNQDSTGFLVEALYEGFRAIFTAWQYQSTLGFFEEKLTTN